MRSVALRSAVRSDLPLLHVTSRAEWRRWLSRHHATSSGVWLVFYKGHTGVASVTYDDSVREALCFGWIDSLIKRLDDDRYARKFTPRAPGSRWSPSNVRRWAELEAAGRPAPVGLAAAPTGRIARPPDAPALPAYLVRALKPHPRAWQFFRRLAPGYRRLYVMWIHAARREATRARRIEQAIALLESGKKLGLK
jgi:uncharacterized protein YdeI (YjbR/CyaY-like superfamily)